VLFDVGPPARKRARPAALRAFSADNARRRAARPPRLARDVNAPGVPAIFRDSWLGRDSHGVAACTAYWRERALRRIIRLYCEAPTTALARDYPPILTGIGGRAGAERRRYWAGSGGLCCVGRAGQIQVGRTEWVGLNAVRIVPGR